MRPLSYTQISRYRDCPLSYKLLYIDRLKPKAKYYLSFGDVVHQCAEYFFKVAVPPPPTLENLLQFYAANWISDGYESPEQEQQYQEFGKQLLADFVKIHAPAFRMPLAVEYQFFINIDGVPLTGKIDRVDKIDGGVSIVDYKTNKELFSQDHLKEDLQLTFYQMAVQKVWDLPVKKLTLYHLRSNTPCSCDGRQREQIEEAREIVVKTAEGISKGLFPAVENQWCDFCDFPEHCPFRKQKYVKEEEQPAEAKKVLDGRSANEIVEQYAALQEQKKALETQLEELKQVICEYCRSGGYSRLYGPEHAISYKMVERDRFQRRPGQRYIGVGGTVAASAQIRSRTGKIPAGSKYLKLGPAPKAGSFERGDFGLPAALRPEKRGIGGITLAFTFLNLSFCLF